LGRKEQFFAEEKLKNMRILLECLPSYCENSNPYIFANYFHLCLRKSHFFVSRIRSSDLFRYRTKFWNYETFRHFGRTP